MTYVIESGIRRRPAQGWTVVDRHEDRDTAYDAMVARALLLRGMYGPHGGRKLRVREIKP